MKYFYMFAKMKQLLEVDIFLNLLKYQQGTLHLAWKQDLLWPWNMKLVLPLCQWFWSNPSSVVSIRTLEPCLYTLYVSLGHIRETSGTVTHPQYELSKG